MTKWLNSKTRQLKASMFLLVNIFSVFIAIANTDSTASVLKNAPKVFVDCNYYCDLSYIKQNITWVNYVRDRKLADVQIIMRVQETASGGNEYQIQFLGFNDFNGLNFTLNYITDPTQTDAEIRAGYLKIIQTGLLPFLYKSKDVLSLINIDYSDPNAKESGEQEVVTDKWRNWVVDLSAGGWTNGQSSTSMFSGWGGVDVRKIVNKWKYIFSLDFNYNENKFKFGETTVLSIRRSKSGLAKVVYALSPKWSAGLMIDAQNSTYNNYIVNLSAYPAIEYNIFPYTESSKHIVRIYYGVSPIYNQYEDTTIFNQTEEFLAQQKLGMSARLVKKWGSLNSSVIASNYLHNFDLNRLSVYTSLRWRIFKGLSFNLSGEISFIRDQINLPKQGASYEEVLLSQKVLATNYSYWANAGISYTFGSIYNSIVNPRFGLD
ncbi:MAG TPA: hypothetical protein DIU39_06295 [Flavobacteriales bacterium]|nr:hypothetical protein [Flavobacteriales bacterium]|tara:strand:- start:59706 stop:61004 length:1299 start_codon:yes stop_codon:yes gene_type:complete